MTIASEPIRLGQAGTIFFDATCGMCSVATMRLYRWIGHRGFTFVPLQAPGAAETLNVDEKELDLEIKLRTPDGQILGGADALISISRYIWWMWPIRMTALVPGMMALMRLVYRIVASNRRRISRVCGLDRCALFISPEISLNTEITDATNKDLRAWDWMFAALPLTAVIALFHSLAPWAWMWLMTVAIWFGFKWLMWRDASAKHGRSASLLKTLLYFIAWPSTNAEPFFKPARTRSARPQLEWVRPIAMLTNGFLLVWCAARLAMPHLLLAGWIGMIGAVLILHFGWLHLVAFIWSAFGFGAAPLMNKPLRSSSVSDFWTRWNSGFHDPALRLVFRPLHRRIGLTGATLATFLFSGVVHDIVISLPARAGFGLPTLYFLIQGIAILFEKSALGRRMNPLLRRLLTYVVLIAPLGLLFHPPFVRNVFVPFLAAIHAI